MNNMTNATEEELELPGLNTWDIVEICYSLVAGAFGIPLNSYIFIKLLRSIRNNSHTRLTLLSLQINIADMLSLWMKSVGYSIWLLTQEWHADDFMCRLFQFMLLFPFYLSSNSRVSIALDLYKSIYSPMAIRISGNKQAKIFIIMSWVLAAIAAGPQLYLFKAGVPFPFKPDWKQCYNYLMELHHNDTMNAYRAINTYHVLVVFWIPFGIIVVLYSLIIMEGSRALNRQTVMKMGLEPGSHIKRPNRTSTAISINVPKHLQVLNGTNSPDIRRQSDAVPKDVYSPLLRQSSSLLNTTVPEEVAEVHQPITTQAAKSYRMLSCKEIAVVEKARVQKLKILKFSVTIILAYILCWLPYQITCVWELIDPEGYQIKFDKYLHWFSALVVLNACINPFLYGFGQTAARRKQADSSNTMMLSTM